MADSPAKASSPTYNITCRPLDNPDGRCIRISLSLDGRIRDLAYYIETQPDEDLKENCRIFQEALEEMNRTLNQAGLTAEHAEFLACAAIPNTVLEKSTSLPPKNRKL